MAFNPETDFRGAHTDVVRHLLKEDQLPRERAGYILARFVLGGGSNKLCLEGTVDRVYGLLTDEETAPLHEPPLPQDLADTIKAYRAHRAEQGLANHVTQADILLLSAAIDHGSREQFEVDAEGSIQRSLV